MSRLTFAVAGAAALVVTSVAVAHGLDGTRGVTRVAATFSASQTKTQTRTCTTTNGKTIATTTARYAGTASGGTADLAGPMTLSTRSVVNTIDGIGTTDGTLRIMPTAGGKTDAHFTAVFDGGTMAGLAVGHTSTHAQLVAAISATVGTTGLSNGKLGGGTAPGSAAELVAGACAPSKTVTQTSEAKGTVSAVTSTSITVAGLTCSVPLTFSTKIATVKQGDRAEIKCSLQNGVNTLVKLEVRH